MKYLKSQQLRSNPKKLARLMELARQKYGKQK